MALNFILNNLVPCHSYNKLWSAYSFTMCLMCTVWVFFYKTLFLLYWWACHSEYSASPSPFTSEINKHLQECRNRIVCFILTCVFLSITCCALQNFQENILPPLHVTACSVPEVKNRLTQMSNRREMDCVGRGWGSVFVQITSILHWKWHIEAFKLMWLPSTFRSFYFAPFTLRPFNFHWSFPRLPSIVETDAP